MAKVSPEVYARMARTIASAGDQFRGLGLEAERAAHEWLRLSEAMRWRRFDTVYGPMIGAAVILGSLALAWLAALGVNP